MVAWKHLEMPFYRSFGGQRGFCIRAQHFILHSSTTLHFARLNLALLKVQNDGRRLWVKVYSQNGSASLSSVF